MPRKGEAKGIALAASLLLGLIVSGSLTSGRAVTNRNLGTKRYAVLVVGSVEERYFWEDVLSMHDVVEEYAFDEVLLLSPDGLDPDGKRSSIIDYCAEDFTSVLGRLARAINESDLLFLWVYSHGGVDVNKVVYICLGEMGLTDHTFGEALNQFECTIVVGVESCFSGAFLDDLSGPKHVVMTSTSEKDESYWDFTNRMAATFKIGNRWADADENGYVSIFEAFDYSSPESSLYDDNGDGTFTSEDGELGRHTYLGLVKTIRTDLDRDGNIDAYDMMMIASVFSTKESDDNWDSRMDFDRNGVINIIDIWEIAKDYGRTIYF